jgi:hypothetical protein
MFFPTRVQGRKRERERGPPHPTYPELAVDAGVAATAAVLDGLDGGAERTCVPEDLQHAIQEAIVLASLVHQPMLHHRWHRTDPPPPTHTHTHAQRQSVSVIHIHVRERKVLGGYVRMRTLVDVPGDGGGGGGRGRDAARCRPGRRGQRLQLVCARRGGSIDVCLRWVVLGRCGGSVLCLRRPGRMLGRERRRPRRRRRGGSGWIAGHWRGRGHRGWRIAGRGRYVCSIDVIHISRPGDLGLCALPCRCLGLQGHHTARWQRGQRRRRRLHWDRTSCHARVRRPTRRCRRRCRRGQLCGGVCRGTVGDEHPMRREQCGRHQRRHAVLPRLQQHKAGVWLRRRHGWSRDSDDATHVFF